MLQIIKGQLNEVIVTVSENVTISNPFFLWVFRLRQSPTVMVKCLAVNTSTVTVRYDSFNITDTANPDNMNGEIEFGTTGEWEYTVYQKATNDLTIPSDTAILETGIVKVIGDESSPISFEPDAEIKVYE